MSADLMPLTAEEIAILRGVADAADAAGALAYTGPGFMRRLIEIVEYAAAKDAEISGLTAHLKGANDSFEKFERLWYLRGDELGKKDAEIAGLREHAKALNDMANAWRAKAQRLDTNATLILDQRDAALKRAERAEADAGRLDWLESQDMDDVYFRVVAHDDEGRWKRPHAIEVETEAGVSVRGKTLRDAIDAAIAASQPPAEGGKP